jgi:hypothetical protein
MSTLGYMLSIQLVKPCDVTVANAALLMGDTPDKVGVTVGNRITNWGVGSQNEVIYEASQVFTGKRSPIGMFQTGPYASEANPIDVTTASSIYQSIFTGPANAAIAQPYEDAGFCAQNAIKQVGVVVSTAAVLSAALAAFTIPATTTGAGAVITALGSAALAKFATSGACALAFCAPELATTSIVGALGGANGVCAGFNGCVSSAIFSAVACQTGKITIAGGQEITNPQVLSQVPESVSNGISNFFNVPNIPGSPVSASTLIRGAAPTALTAGAISGGFAYFSPETQSATVALSQVTPTISEPGAVGGVTAGKLIYTKFQQGSQAAAVDTPVIVDGVTITVPATQMAIANKLGIAPEQMALVTEAQPGISRLASLPPSTTTGDFLAIARPILDRLNLIAGPNQYPLYNDFRNALTTAVTKAGAPGVSSTAAISSVGGLTDSINALPAASKAIFTPSGIKLTGAAATTMIQNGQKAVGNALVETVKNPLVQGVATAVLFDVDVRPVGAYIDPTLTDHIIIYHEQSVFFGAIPTIYRACVSTQQTSSTVNPNNLCDPSQSFYLADLCNSDTAACLYLRKVPSTASPNGGYLLLAALNSPSVNSQAFLTSVISPNQPPLYAMANNLPAKAGIIDASLFQKLQNDYSDSGSGKALATSSSSQPATQQGNSVSPSYPYQSQVSIVS